MSEEKKEANNSSEVVPDKPVKLGPKVLSHINLEDGDFIIADNEIGYLPADYEKRTGIKFYVEKGRFEFLEKEETKKEEGITLDNKDVVNFLNQNTKTVMKQLKVNKLSNKDLDKLVIAERNGKKRKKIVDFIKIIKEVN